LNHANAKCEEEQFENNNEKSKYNNIDNLTNNIPWNNNPQNNHHVTNQEGSQVNYNPNDDNPTGCYFFCE